MRLLFTLSLCSIFLFACRKTVDPPEVFGESYYDILVVNEGAFGAGNGNLTAYDKVSNQTLSNPVEVANGGPLGDVAQSAYLVNNEFWVVINNSNKILILDTASYKIKAEIKDLNTPKFGVLEGYYFYVGSLYSDEFYAINISDHTVSTYYTGVSGITDMISVDGRILVTASDSSNSKILAFDTDNQVFSDFADLGVKAPFDICREGQDICVLSGNSWLGVPYYITHVSRYGSSVAAFPLMAGEYKSLESYENKVYILANDYSSTGGPNGIFEVSSTSAALHPVVSVPTAVSTFYSFGIDPENGDFYAADAKTYTVNGDVYRFDHSGTQKAVFEAGIIPGFFMFR